MTKHTQWGWFSEQVGVEYHEDLAPIEGHDEGVDCVLCHTANWPVKDEHKLLIAAAPDMLEALEEIIKADEIGMGAIAIKLRLDRARDIVAKATGKQS